MGDHFGLLVDRLLTESTLEAAIEGQNKVKHAVPLARDDVLEGDFTHKMDSGNRLYPRKVVECRICQDEDEDANMEAPCSCCGSLKYAHRRCVQRWCNEKGDTVCEICHQHFKPGYTAPPHVFQFRDIPMNLRENWEVSRRNLNNPRIIAMVSTDRNFFDDPDYDEFAASTAKSLVCCRLVAFMLLLILRHTLPVIIDGSDDYSFPLSTVLLLRTTGIVLPIYVIFTSVTAMQRRRRRRQVLQAVSATSSEEDIEQTTLHHQPPHIIHVH